MQCDVSKPDWKTIKAEYDAKQTTVSDICARHRITSSCLYRRIRRDAWIIRRASYGSSRLIAAAPLLMLERVKNIIARRIVELEDVQADQIRGETALESERQARAIFALVRAIDHLATVDDRLLEKTDKAEDSNDAQTDAWSADLAEALAALAARQAGSCQAEDVSAGRATLDELGADGET